MEYTPPLAHRAVRSRLAITSILELAASLSLTWPASAIDFEYVRIVAATDTAAGSSFPYGAITDFDFDGNNIVFRGNAGGSLYMRTPSGISPLLNSSTPLPGSTGSGNVSMPSVSGTDIGFSKVESGFSSHGLYVTRNGNISLLADLSTPIPNGSGNFQGFWFGSSSASPVDLSINSALSNGTAVFGGTGSGGQAGVYYAGTDGAIHRIIDQSTAVKAYGGPTIDGNNVALLGRVGGQTGVYRFSISDQALTPVVAPGTPLPVGTAIFSTHAPAISGENIAFAAGATEDQGDAIYVATNSGLHLVAQTGMPAPGGSGLFTGDLAAFGVTLSGTAVAFRAVTTSGAQGAYTNFGGQLAKVIDTNTLLEGNFVTSINAAPKISGSNVAFVTNRGLYVALGEHHWGNAGGGLWDTSSNWSFGLAPRGLISTFVDPANGATITGPAGNVSLKSLTVGAAQSGTAQLQLQSSGQLSVNGPVTITSRGRVDVAGTISATGAITNSGIIAGSGQVAGQLINSTSGEIRVTTGNSLLFSSGPNVNAGTIDLNGGQIEFSQGLVNQPSTGLIAARGATLRFGAGLTNAGAVALVSGTSDVFGDIQNAGTITITGGTGAATHTAIFHDDVVQNGTLTVSAAGQTRSVAVFLGSFGGAGGISGGGDVFFEGDLRPGNSPASVSMDTNVFFGPQARIVLELGGVTLGTQYDHLSFGGSVGVNGSLQISLVNGFVPQGGNSFDLFDFGVTPPTGAFSDIDLPGLEPGLSWDTSAMLTEGTLRVIPEASAGLFAVTGSLLLIALHRRRNHTSRSCSFSWS